MTVLIKIIVVIALSVPLFFLNKTVVSFLSGRIEKELEEQGEEFSKQKNPKKLSLIFYFLTLVFYILSAVVSSGRVDMQSIIGFALVVFLIFVLSVVSRLDATYYIIPNGICLLILSVSAVFSVIFPLVFGIEIFASVLECLIGFLVGGLSLFLINLLSKLVFKRDGMGGGDVKLMFGVGLLLGWKLTVLALLIAFIVGAVCGVIFRMASKSGEDLLEIPFGPYLAIAGVVSALFGNSIISWYLGFLGF